MMNNIYKIGEVANMIATSIRTIRYYEEESLIEPIRTKKGTRLYSKPHIQRLKAILELTRNGFSIETIKKIGTTREKCSTGKESSRQLSVLLDESLSNIEAQLQALELIKVELESAKNLIMSCGECNNHPSTKGCPDCLVIQKLDKVKLLNLIWDVGKSLLQNP